MTNVILVVILLHLVLGFGWLMYKLSPRAGDEEYIEDENSDD